MNQSINLGVQVSGGHFNADQVHTQNEVTIIDNSLRSSDSEVLADLRDFADRARAEAAVGGPVAEEDVAELSRVLEPASQRGPASIDRGRLKTVVEKLVQAAPALGALGQAATSWLGQ
ncbi:hypothetical protein OG562_13560 [Streptomyces sp. NBC_01275]|uniref:hypothetical protein n=1 Tax=Streptomyces sp. NBC_01275 TaxID=2903807 RepID=UPI002251C6F0|nr:hypothetical protein [Streptomyces sp. NBC_01275]MCX4761981.1 hypothetical protein [Streptomyces sp. NBC_01275]